MPRHAAQGRKAAVTGDLILIHLGEWYGGRNYLLAAAYPRQRDSERYPINPSTNRDGGGTNRGGEIVGGEKTKLAV